MGAVLAGSQDLGSARRLIVKIGSALMVDAATHKIRTEWLDTVADDVATLRARGVEVVIVTSGAVACGRAGWRW